MFVYIVTVIFVFTFCGAQVYHHSTAGEYYVEWKGLGPCPPEKRGTNEILFDIHLSRKHRKTEMVGNVTLLTPFDDSCTVNANFAILGKNAGWLPNAYELPLPRACSTMKNFFKEGWTNFLKSANVSTKCPIQKGFYTQKGYDIDNFLESSSFPKQFIYGRYRINFEVLKKKTVIGCIYLMVELVPLWQKKQQKDDQ